MPRQYDIADSVTFLGFVATPEFCTDRSIGFVLLERHSEHVRSLRGWIDIHYPCEGIHVLRIRACLDPQMIQFASHEHFCGHPSKVTDALVERLVKEVQEYLKLETAVSWHLDLQARSAGMFAEDPQTVI